MAGISNTLAQAKEFFQNLSTGKKLSFFLLIAVVAGGLSYLIVWGNTTDYRVLFSELDPADASAIVEHLKQAKIPYKLLPDNSVMVPAEQVSECKLDLASQGLPQGGAVGFELFDKNNLGMSEYMQKLNYTRALQGELARTINQFNEVKYSRVHIVIPERSLFAEDERRPSASVALQLKQGARLSESQVRGIVNLVSNSVEGLDAQNISVVTTSGEMLYAGQNESPTHTASAAHEELRHEVEQNLETKLRSILDQALGYGKSIVRVAAEVEVKDLKQSKELYDPNASVVRSEQRNSEESQNVEEGPSGVPGVEPNVIGQEPAQTAGVTSRFKKSNETINYEISKTVENIIEPVREIKRLSVAVLIDGSYKTVTNDKGEETKEYMPRPDDEISKIRAVVEKAMGFSKLRGDQLEVANLPFEQMEMSKEDKDMMESMERRKFWAPYIKYGIMAALFFVAFFFVVRPILKQVLSGATEIPVKRGPVDDVPQLEDMSVQEQPKLEKKEPSEEEMLLDLAKKNPEKFAMGLRTWIGETEFNK